MAWPATRAKKRDWNLLPGVIDDKIGEMRGPHSARSAMSVSVIMAALTMADNLGRRAQQAATERQRSAAAEERAQAIASNLDELGSRLGGARHAPRGRRGLIRYKESPHLECADCDTGIYPGMKTICYCAAVRTGARKTTALYNTALEPAGVTVAQFSLLRKINAPGRFR